MDLLQITLIIVLTLLAINLIAVGIYVILVLKDFRETIRKANKVLDNVGDVTGVVSGPVSTLAGIISGFGQSVKAVKEISNLVDRPKKKEGKGV